MRKKDDDIDGGWAWFVLVAVYLGIIILSTTMFMGGVLYVALLDHFKDDEAKTSLVGALNGGLLCLLGPLASIIMTTFSCRTCMLIGGILSAVSCLASAFVQNIDILILTYGLIGGIGSCLTSTPFVVVLGYYFHKRRNIIIAISQAVIGVGFFIASPLAIIILKNFGLKGTFLILGGINAHLCVIAIICKPSSVEQRIHARKSIETKRHRVENDDEFQADTMLSLTEYKVDYEIELSKDACNKYEVTVSEHIGPDSILKQKLKQDEEREHDTFGTNSCYDERHCNRNKETMNTEYNTACMDLKDEGLSLMPFQNKTNNHCNKNLNENVFNDKCTRKKHVIFKLHLVKDIRFIMFLLSTLSWNFTLSLCILHLPNYMAVRGAGDVEISAIMTCFSASNLAGRFIAAMTVEKGGMDSLTLHVGMLGVAGVVTLLFPLYSGAVGDYIFAAAIGLYTGGPNSLMTPITLKMVHIEDLSVAHGLEYFFSGLGYVPGPFIAGLLYTVSGAYEFSFICGGCVLMVGCVLAMVSAVKFSTTTESTVVS